MMEKLGVEKLNDSQENMLNNLHTNNILMMCSTLFYFGVNIMNSIEGLKHHKLNVFLK